jgi:hypothetical protein
MPYLIQHPSGVFYAQRKVPEWLQEAVARVLKSQRPRLVFLKRSLGTTPVRSQANISIKPVLIEFDRILKEAEALENSKPKSRGWPSTSMARPYSGTSACVSMQRVPSDWNPGI